MGSFDSRWTLLGIDGNLNNNNPSLGCSMGFKLKNDSNKSVGLDTGIDFSYKENATPYITGTAGYNSDIETKNYDRGPFADVNAKFKLGIENNEQIDGYEDPYSGTLKMTGLNISGKIGYRDKSSYASSHTNYSVFGEYNTFEDQKSTKIVGLEYAESDGDDEMFAKVGIKDNSKGLDPFVGVGFRMRFSPFD